MLQANKSKALTLTAMTLGFVMVQLDVTVVNVAIKSIGNSLGNSVSNLQWVVNVYTLTFAAFILTAGALGDRIGAKRVFIIGFALFTILSLACGLAPNIGILIAARAIQGIGAAILVPCSLSLLNHTYNDPGERAWAIGIWAAGASTALAAGPVLGGGLIAIFGWRSIFFINLPIGLAGIWLTVKYAAETTRSSNRGVDLWGQLAIAGSLIFLAASMIEGGKVGWTNTYVLAGFILFVVSMAAFIYIEKRIKEPMLPLSLFQIRTFTLTTIIGFLINISFYGLIFIFSLYFQQVRGLSPIKAGLAFLPVMGAVLSANLVASRLSKLIGSKRLILLGELLFLAGCLALLSLGKQSPFIWIAIPLFFTGLGVGFVVPSMTSSMLGSVDKSQSGVASGVLNAMRQAGSVVGVALLGSLVATQGRFMPGFHLALIIAVVSLAFSVAAGLSISKN